jgi:hypothetical protein
MVELPKRHATSLYGGQPKSSRPLRPLLRVPSMEGGRELAPGRAIYLAFFAG